MRAATAYAVLWIGWIALFLAIEMSALWSGHPQWTLSDFVWRLEQINRSWTFVRFFVCAGCVWLFFHMAFGWFR
jgi:hypothetical protein